MSYEDSETACDICGRPACITDGMVSAYLCRDRACFHAAWDLAFGEDL